MGHVTECLRGDARPQVAPTVDDGQAARQGGAGATGGGGRRLGDNVAGKWWADATTESVLASFREAGVFAVK